MLHKICKGRDGTTTDANFREMGEIRRAIETEDIQLRSEHATASLRNK